MRVKRHLAVLVALVSVGLVAGALGALPANADPPNIRRDGGVHYIRGGGSDTTYEMMVGLADQYNATPGCITSQSGFTFPENGTCIDFDPVTPGIQPHWEDPVIQAGANPDHNIIWQFYPYGSSNGIKVLTDTGQPNVTERFRFARSSRAPSGSDPAGLRFVGYARDAIPWVKYDDSAVATEPSDGVTNLTQAQLQGIFTGCTNTNWNQVGGNNGPIIVWSAQSGSGTRSTFDGFVGGDSTTCIPANQKDGNTANGERVVFENQSTNIFNSSTLDCETSPGVGPTGPCTGNSIFFYSRGRFNEAPPVSGTISGVLGNINGVAPTDANISSGAYLYSRTVFNVIRNAFASDNANGAVRSYFDGDGWLCASNLPNNPKTGVNYRTELENIIKAQGFVPFPVGAQGGGFPNGFCRITDT